MHDNPAMREEMGKIGVEKVKKFYSWSKIIPMWDKLIKNMVNE